MAAVTGVTNATTTTQSSVSDAANSQISKDTFLQLLVAQIKNQNPLSPADGVQFVSQLAQFSELEQVMGVREELQAFHSDLKPAAPADKSAAASQQVIP